MASSPFVFLVFLLSFFTAVVSQPPTPKGILIDCGAAAGYGADGLTWLPDAPFVSSGVSKTLAIPGLLQQLSTVRTFPFSPFDGPRKFCYSFPAVRGAKYLVRTTYFYGGVNGRGAPPVFDQIVDGTLWTVVNTTADYERNMSSYYEGVYRARGRKLGICLGANVYTDSDPFISAIELIILEGSVYNTTDFSKHAMGLVARTSFGHSGPIFRYPNDKFDRFWQPFSDGIQAIRSSQNVPVSDFWNLPPLSIFGTALMADQPKPMELQWPPFSLPNSSYYIALYFADPSSGNSRVFDVSINGISFCSDLNVTTAGASVFTTQWPLYGLTKLTLTPSVESNLPPLINGGEIFSILRLGRMTLTRDVTALENFKKSIQNPPLNWNGDPCFPSEFSWTGIACSEGPHVRVLKLDLSNMGLSGALSRYIANLTALSEILLGNNSFSGPIPDFSRLRMLEKLHLQDNRFSGALPSSLGNLTNLRELHLQDNRFTGVLPSSVGNLTNLRELLVQNNNLSGEIPFTLRRPGLILQTAPGNHFTSSP